MQGNGSIPTTIGIPDSNYGEYSITHTWLGSSALGVSVIARGKTPEAPRGVIISKKQADAGLPDEIQLGMLMETVQGIDVTSHSFTQVTDIVRLAGRPLRITFVSHVEHAFLNKILNLFKEADKDESGALDATELKQVLTQMHSSEGASDDKDEVDFDVEVEECLSSFDHDESGHLEFPEFVEMLASRGTFLSLDEMQREKVLELAELVEHQLSKEEASPYGRRISFHAVTASKRFLRGIVRAHLDAIRSRDGTMSLKSLVEMLDSIPFPGDVHLRADAVEILKDLIEEEKTVALSLASFLDLLGQHRYSLMDTYHAQDDTTDIMRNKEISEKAHQYLSGVSIDALQHIQRVKDLFLEADVDCSGALDAQELASIFRIIYKEGGMARKVKTIEVEVKEALRKWEMAGTNGLDIGGCIELYASPEFGIRKFLNTGQNYDSVMLLVAASGEAYRAGRIHQSYDATVIQGAISGYLSRIAFKKASENDEREAMRCIIASMQGARERRIMRVAESNLNTMLQESGGEEGGIAKVVSRLRMEDFDKMSRGGSKGSSVEAPSGCENDEIHKIMRKMADTKYNKRITTATLALQGLVRGKLYRNESNTLKEEHNTVSMAESALLIQGTINMSQTKRVTRSAMQEQDAANATVIQGGVMGMSDRMGVPKMMVADHADSTCRLQAGVRGKEVRMSMKNDIEDRVIESVSIIQGSVRGHDGRRIAFEGNLCSLPLLTDIV